jgi:hypothetical protein
MEAIQMANTKIDEIRTALQDGLTPKMMSLKD